MMEVKNILFLIGKYPNYGGTEKITTFLANKFRERGYGVHIASFEQPLPLLSDELNKGVILHKLSLPVYKCENERLLRAIICDNNIDIILNQWCLPFYTTILCNKARKGTYCKLISVLHGIPDNSKKIIVQKDALANATNVFLKCICRLKLKLTNAIIQRSERYVYCHSDRYVLLSDSFKQIFCQYAGIRENGKLLSISNPLTIKSEFDTDVLSHKKKHILYVGRMDKENKRVNRIIEAWEEIYDDYVDWQLVLVGDGPHKQLLEDYVKQKNIQRCLFTGFVKEEPINFYKDASIFMLTSDLEGFGLVAVESMSYGCVPIVYGSYSSIYDIITNGEDGFITPMPYSKAATVRHLRKLIETPNLFRQMSEKAQEKSKHFSADVIMNKWQQLFENL